MGRKKIKDKNLVRSVSLPHQLCKWIDENKDFNLSKFLSVYLQDYINNHPKQLT